MTREAYYITVIFVTFIASLLAARVAVLLCPKFLRLREYKVYYFLRQWLVWIMVSIYTFIFSALSIIKFNAYNMAMVDLGRMDQAIWNTLHGRLLFCTLESGNACRLIMHSEFIYILIAPLYIFFPTPKIILVLQSLVVALGALPIFWLAREKLGSLFTAVCFVGAYLLHPALEYGNLLDFHPDMLATTFLLFTFYFLDRERWVKYFIFLVLSLMCKEYISLIGIMFGAYIFVFKKNANKIAGISLILGLGWFLMTYKVIPGYLQSGKENTMVEYFTHLGPDMRGIAENAIFNPLSTLFRLLTFNNIANLLFLLLPVGFLSLFNVQSLLISLPVFLGLLLSPFFSYANHHNGTIIPFIFISSILGAKYLWDRYHNKFKNIQYALGAFIFCSSLLSNVFYGQSPLSWRFWNPQSYRYFDNLAQFKITEHDKITDKILKIIPRDALVSASNHLASHISQRETIYHFPHPGDFRKVDFVLVDLLEYFPIVWLPRQQEINNLKKIILDDNFTLRYNEDGILLFEKANKKKEGFYLGVSKLKGAQPKNTVNLSFDNRLLLLGYDLEEGQLKIGKSYRITYYWKVLEDFAKAFSYSYFGLTDKLDKEYILMDTFYGQNSQLRLIHLPAYILYGPKDWQVGDIIKEELDFYLPERLTPGVYKWKTGLYITPNFYFIQTQKENLVPGTEEICLGIKEFK